jgi:transposase
LGLFCFWPPWGPEAKLSGDGHDFGNPKLIHRFAQTLRRSKTDSADAQVLSEYSCRMPFTPWSAPELSGLRLRTISRHIQSLVVEQTRRTTAFTTRKSQPRRHVAW